MRTALRIAATVVALAVVAVALVEVVGRFAVERVARTEIADAAEADAEVSLGRGRWDPVVATALATGRLERIEVRLRDAEMSSLPVREADYVLTDVRVDLDLVDRQLTVLSIGSGSVRIEVDPAEIGGALGVTVEADGGEVLVDGSPVELSVEDGQLVVGEEDGAGPRRLPLPGERFLPCTPDVEVRDSVVVLGCSGSTLPGVLADPLGPRGGAPPAPPELEPPATLELEPGG